MTDELNLSEKVLKGKIEQLSFEIGTGGGKTQEHFLSPIISDQILALVKEAGYVKLADTPVLSQKGIDAFVDYSDGKISEERLAEILGINFYELHDALMY